MKSTNQNNTTEPSLLQNRLLSDARVKSRFRFSKDAKEWIFVFICNVVIFFIGAFIYKSINNSALSIGIWIIMMFLPFRFLKKK